MSDDRYVSQEECVSSRKEVITLLNNTHDAVQKHGKALYGDDGRGGMQKDITKILTKLENGEIKSSLGLGDKVVVALITVAGSVIVALIANGVL